MARPQRVQLDLFPEPVAPPAPKAPRARRRRPVVGPELVLGAETAPLEAPALSEPAKRRARLRRGELDA